MLMVADGRGRDFEMLMSASFNTKLHISIKKLEKKEFLKKEVNTILAIPNRNNSRNQVGIKIAFFNVI